MDIDLGNGFITIPHPKEKKPKFVPLLEEDAELLRTVPGGFPDQHFFRHPKGLKGCTEGSRYGNRYFYKWWKKACRNLGVEEVDLYGGTRHSSAKALRQYRTPEEIKKATMHSTNKAFERYFQMGTDDIRAIYGDTRTSAKKQGNVVNFKSKEMIKE
jgi:integrase